MKRSGPLPRYAELKRGSSQLRSSPKRLTPKEKDARDITEKRSGGWCELRIKSVCQGPATNKQHRLAEGQGGPTVASNLIDVCGMGNASGCHGHIHQNPTLAVKKGWTVKSGKDWRKQKVVLWDGVFLLHDDGSLEDVPADEDESGVEPQHKEAS